MKVRVRQSSGKTTYLLWCPACDDVVSIDDTWGWNGDTERPTFAPSLLTRISLVSGEQVCHSFVTEGEWIYLDDCTHAMASQAVPMADLPDWVLAE